MCNVSVCNVSVCVVEKHGSVMRPTPSTHTSTICKHALVYRHVLTLVCCVILYQIQLDSYRRSTSFTHMLAVCKSHRRSLLHQSLPCHAQSFSLPPPPCSPCSPERAELEALKAQQLVCGSEDDGFLRYLAASYLTRGMHQQALQCLQKLTVLAPGGAVWGYGCEQICTRNGCGGVAAMLKRRFLSCFCQPMSKARPFRPVTVWCVDVFGVETLSSACCCR